MNHLCDEVILEGWNTSFNSIFSRFHNFFLAKIFGVEIFRKRFMKSMNEGIHNLLIFSLTGAMFLYFHIREFKKCRNCIFLFPLKFTESGSFKYSGFFLQLLLVQSCHFFLYIPCSYCRKLAES